MKYFILVRMFLKYGTIFFALLILIPYTSQAQRSETDLSGKGWALLMDKDTSSWKNEELFLPSVKLETIPVHTPSGGWQALQQTGIPVSVPGSVEEYIPRKPGPQNIIKGVSWWYRNVDIPNFKTKKTIHLAFESTYYRAEIFVNHKLVGYNLVPGTPTDIDLTNVVQTGTKAQIAVRITNPGGYLDWRDNYNIKWGKYQVPVWHGFSGITGRVQLVYTDKVYTDEIFVENTPLINTVIAHVTVINSLSEPVSRKLDIAISAKGIPSKTLYKESKKRILFKPGINVIPVKITAPSAKQWDLDHPELYTCKVKLSNLNEVTDEKTQVFGFRWFNVKNIGKNAQLTLNNKRIVLRTAISWSFWPENGVYPSASMAKKQVGIAKKLGLNMLNFHRCIGQPIVFDQADEQGLLYYEEPGGYVGGVKDPFAKAILREKLLRMVRRDRSHPSLIIYNMQNEMRDVDATMLESQIKDMKDAHLIDPSRIITRTSGWAGALYKDDQAKINMRPLDTTLYKNGWYDFHHATGPPVWQQAFYQNPTKYYNNTDNASEVVYWGEEGALSAPPRLQLIKKELDKKKNLGWDGQEYLRQFSTCDSFLTVKNLRGSFADVDAFTTTLGKVSFEHQGRKIENIRINNYADGYATNGWESELYENHSGIVDCFRNPKADPAIIAYYNQPLFVSIKIRNQVLDMPGKLVFDVFALNEVNKNGAYDLKIQIKSPGGDIVFQKNIPVKLSGGDVYGELLAQEITYQPQSGSSVGFYNITAQLVSKSGQIEASGKDQFFAVDWRSEHISGKGAVFENGHIIKDFLSKSKHVPVSTYTDTSGKLDWLIIARSPKAGTDLVPVPAECLRTKDGLKNGITTTFYEDINFNKKAAVREKNTVNLSVAEGETPDPDVKTTENYSAIWEGSIIPPFTGNYHFQVAYTGSIEVEINHKLVMSGNSRVSESDIQLEAGKPVQLTVRYSHGVYTGLCKLLWSTPDPIHIDIQQVIERVKNDGTKLILLEGTPDWINSLLGSTGTSYMGSFAVGSNWLGGSLFVRKHKLFRELPVDQALNWPYQALVSNGGERLGLIMKGEELVAGAYHSYPFKLGTSVGIIPAGKGKIIFSTLNMVRPLISDDQAAAVAKKLLVNFINY